MAFQLGLSTGALSKSGLNHIARIGSIFRTGCRAIELSFLRLNEFTRDDRMSLPFDTLKRFEYISTHAPIHEYGDDPITYRIFEEIRKLHEKLRFSLAVFHPDTIVDFSVFHNLEFPVGFENMDRRKKRFKTPRELTLLMEMSPNFKFILDLNHVYSNDPAMESAYEFYDQLRPRLAQIHLSGYNGHHVPLFQTKQVEIINAVRDSDTPIIIESALSPEDLLKELKYVEKHMLMNGQI